MSCVEAAQVLTTVFPKAWSCPAGTTALATLLALVGVARPLLATSYRLIEGFRVTAWVCAPHENSVPRMYFLAQRVAWGYWHGEHAGYRGLVDAASRTT